MDPVMVTPALHRAMVRIDRATPGHRQPTKGIARRPGIGSTERLRRRRVTPAAQAQTIAGCKARGFLPNTAASTM